MRRRSLLVLMPLVAGGLTSAIARAQSSDAEASPPRLPGIALPLALLQGAMAQRFPLRYPVPGLLNLDVQVPQLSLRPEENRLAAAMEVVAAGPALNRSHRGSFGVDFALRYEARDRTIRAHRLRFHGLRFPTLQPAVVDMLNTYGPALAEQSLQEVVLHQLRPQDLSMADVLGLRPGLITVTNDGLLIGFEVKPL